MRSRRHPQWRQAYLIFTLFLGTLAVESRLPLRAGEHQVVLIGLTVAFFGLLNQWLTTNRGMLDRDDAEQHPFALRIDTIDPGLDRRRLSRGAWTCQRLRDAPHRKAVH